MSAIRGASGIMFVPGRRVISKDGIETEGPPIAISVGRWQLACDDLPRRQTPRPARRMSLVPSRLRAIVALGGIR